jgi:hypothetical protein
MTIDDNPGKHANPGLTDNNIRWFNEQCVGEETKYDLHTDSGIPIEN